MLDVMHVFTGHTCLGSNHEGSIAIIVLVVDVY